VRILGIQTGHDSNICLLEDGKIITHLEIERVSRVKQDRIWKKNNLGTYINMIFKKCGVKWDDIDKIALIGAVHGRKNPRLVSEFSFIPESRHKDIHIVDHHVAHAAASFYFSPYEKSSIFSLDGGGNDGGGLLAYGNGNSIKVDKVLGTDFPGDGPVGQIWHKSMLLFSDTPNGPIGTEGVLMGASSYGTPIESLSKVLYHYFSNMTEAWKNFQPNILRLLNEKESQIWHEGKTFDPNNEQDYFDYCASLQLATEKYLEQKCKEIKALHPHENKVCITGGVLLNCLAVGRIMPKYFDKIFAGPAITDGGLGMGAALYYYHHILNNPRSLPADYMSPYLGFEREEGDILKAIQSCGVKITYEKINSIESVVGHIIDGKIVALYQGRSEVGRRALGNRSILADPRSKEMKKNINKKVKHRHWYRPFAPSILEEHVGEVFCDEYDSPYMSIALKIRDEWVDKVPAVTHNNQTARLQTVSEKINPHYHKLISAFYQKTGVPLLLNTSFNDNEPIVETPEDALACFLNTEIDYLYIGDFLVKKS